MAGRRGVDQDAIAGRHPGQRGPLAVVGHDEAAAGPASCMVARGDDHPVPSCCHAGNVVQRTDTTLLRPYGCTGTVCSQPIAAVTASHVEPVVHPGAPTCRTTTGPGPASGGRECRYAPRRPVGRRTAEPASVVETCRRLIALQPMAHSVGVLVCQIRHAIVLALRRHQGTHIGCLVRAPPAPRFAVEARVACAVRPSLSSCDASTTRISPAQNSASVT